MEISTSIEGRTARKTNKSNKKEILIFLLLIAISAFLFYQGFIYIDNRLEEIKISTETNINQRLNEIQETNAVNIRILEEQIQSLLAQMEEIQFVLSQTDQTIGFSAVTQMTLSAHIEELEGQLRELQRGMELLQDAFNKKN